MQEKNLEISQRIGQVIDYLGISKVEFSNNLGYTKPNVVYETLNGKAKPSFEFWERFFNSEYSKIIDGTWLITGKGSMLKSPGFVVQEEPGEYKRLSSEMQTALLEKQALEEKVAKLESELATTKAQLVFAKEMLLEFKKESPGENKNAG